MHIRTTTLSDLDAVMAIFRQAQTTIARLGIDQWQNGYPSESVVAEDIRLNRSWVAEQSGQVCATFVLVDDGEITYDRIYHGHWLTGDDNRSYTAVHRVAVEVKYRGRGMGDAIVNYAMNHAKQMGHTSLRIDTHQGNLPMRRMLERNGFVHCGSIYLCSGDHRVAYEKPVP